VKDELQDFVPENLQSKRVYRGFESFKSSQQQSRASSKAALICIALGGIAALGFFVALSAGYGPEALGFLASLIIGLPVYFLPTILASKHRNQTAIFALNLLLGWTLLGWVVALVWALYKDKPGH
jgi:hypothetical protein